MAIAFTETIVYGVRARLHKTNVDQAQRQQLNDLIPVRIRTQIEGLFADAWVQAEAPIEQNNPLISGRIIIVRRTASVILQTVRTQLGEEIRSSVQQALNSVRNEIANAPRITCCHVWPILLDPAPPEHTSVTRYPSSFIRNWPDMVVVTFVFILLVARILALLLRTP